MADSESMDESVDILSPGALQSLGLAPDFLDASPLDMTDINDTVYQHSLSLPDINDTVYQYSLSLPDINDTVYQHSLLLPDINPEPSELQGLGEVGSDFAILPEFVTSLGPIQGLPDVQERQSATLCNTNHTDSNISVPVGGQDNALSPRKRLAPKILVFPTADGQGKRQRRRFSDAKRQEVAQVRKDGACMRCHLSKTSVRRDTCIPLFLLQ